MLVFLFFLQCLQTVYFGCSIVNDIFGSDVLPSEYCKVSSITTWQRVRDFIAAAVAFPGSMVNCYLCVYSIEFICNGVQIFGL